LAYLKIISIYKSLVKKARSLFNGLQIAGKKYCRHQTDANLRLIAAGISAQASADVATMLT